MASKNNGFRVLLLFLIVVVVLTGCLSNTLLKNEALDELRTQYSKIEKQLLLELRSVSRWYEHQETAAKMLEGPDSTLSLVGESPDPASILDRQSRAVRNLLGEIDSLGKRLNSALNQRNGEDFTKSNRLAISKTDRDRIHEEILRRSATVSKWRVWQAMSLSRSNGLHSGDDKRDSSLIREQLSIVQSHLSRIDTLEEELAKISEQTKKRNLQLEPSPPLGKGALLGNE